MDLISAPGVRYVHVPSTEAGCYITRLERWDVDHAPQI